MHSELKLRKLYQTNDCSNALGGFISYNLRLWGAVKANSGLLVFAARSGVPLPTGHFCSTSAACPVSTSTLRCSTSAFCRSSTRTIKRKRVNYASNVEIPTSVIDFRDKIKSADALIFATPEYNGSVSGALKNAFDWASRDYSKSGGDGPAIAGKKIGTNFYLLRHHQCFICE